MKTNLGLKVVVCLFIMAVLLVPSSAEAFNGSGSWQGLIDIKDGKLVTEFEYRDGSVALVSNYNVAGSEPVRIPFVEINDQRVIPVQFYKGVPYIPLVSEGEIIHSHAFLTAEVIEEDGFTLYIIKEAEDMESPLCGHSTVSSIVLSIPYEVDGRITTIPILELDGSLVIPLVRTHTVVTPSGREKILSQDSLEEDLDGYELVALEWDLHGSPPLTFN